MTRILTTGTLLLVLVGIAWSFPGCGDGSPNPDAHFVDTSPSRTDAPIIPVDTTASLDAPTPTVDTTAALPDAAPSDAAPG